jgi:UDP-N-acetylglucosamine transferase subunit ALG13
VIFVTVGTQLTFDRLIKAVDEWAGSRGRADVFAQVGPSELAARAITVQKFITPQECDQKMRAADVIVAHAGMGSILTALELGKPIIVMPRRASLGEHRNDHQLATARRFAELGSVSVAMDEKELVQRLDAIGQIGAAPRISPFASERLIGAVRAFIHGEPIPVPQPSKIMESINA